MEIEELIREKRLKLTPQRKAIVEVLINADTLLSAQEVFSEVLKKLPGINFSTIYRNLDVLLDKGILCKITPESGGAVLYELRRKKGHHHHIICKKCGTSIPLDYCPMEEIKNELDKKGFSPTEHRFEVYGYCEKCIKGGYES